jgi:fluoroquinolone resistance protein
LGNLGLRLRRLLDFGLGRFGHEVDVAIAMRPAGPNLTVEAVKVECQLLAPCIGELSMATTLEELLQGEAFENATFSGLDLQKASLADKEFYRCTFENCLLQESTWKNAKLESCTFRGCDLTRTALLQTALRGVQFLECKLMGVNWATVSTHPEVKFTECNLRYASFVRINLRKTAFTKCSIREATFLESDLTDADFTGSDLAGTTIQGCTLALTDFRSATGVFFEPARNKLKKPRVPVETAVLIAQHFGLVVDGFK